ncbi:MAG: Pvc16 family protein, partial [Polyangiaceae bacterium]
MGYERQHEVVRDCTLTFAHILRTYLPPRLDQKPVECIFDLPDPAQIDAVAAEGKVLVSIVLIETLRSSHQKIEEPIVREEDTEGNIVEFRLGSPTMICPRYMITACCKDQLESQVVQGLIMQLFFDHPEFLPDDVQGESIHGEERAPIHFDDKFRYQDQIAVWQGFGKPFRASLMYSVEVR